MEKPCLYLREEEVRRAEKFFHENGLEGSIIGAAPGASFGPAKRWGPENYAKTLSMLSKDLGAGVIVFGGPEDREACSRVFDLTEARHKKNLSGRITLREFMALASRLTLFLANDSGPMHIVASMGVPMVAVFGSTDPALTGPMGRNAHVVIKKAPCSPCFERTCRYGHYDCLTSVLPSEVYREALKALEVSPEDKRDDGEKLSYNGLS